MVPQLSRRLTGNTSSCDSGLPIGARARWQIDAAGERHRRDVLAEQPHLRYGSRVTCKTFGHGDPRLPATLVALHDAAVAAGHAMYLDPDLGLWVQTSETLSKNGRCCGKCCRHCPFGSAEQRAAGRPLVRPEGLPLPASSGPFEPQTER